MLSKSDIWVVTDATAVSNLKLEVNEIIDEELWTKMQINLPFQVEEQFHDDGIVPRYKLTNVIGKLMMFLELIGVQSNYKELYHEKLLTRKTLI